MGFFVPTPNLSWEYLNLHYAEFLRKDIDGVDMLETGFSDMICIKGIDGDTLSVVYTDDYTPPDFTEIVAFQS